jgi:hypothetical protein
VSAPPGPRWLAKRVLLGPATLRRAAARRAGPEERWMLAQPLEVRRSYVREVLDRGGGDALEQAWILHQPDPVRHSYVAEVLGVERL